MIRQLKSLLSHIGMFQSNWVNKLGEENDGCLMCVGNVNPLGGCVYVSVRIRYMCLSGCVYVYVCVCVFV